MGIKRLNGYIKSKLPHVKKVATLANHAGEHWGVDVSCLLYRARGVSLTPVTVIASLIVRLRQAGITPIFIFDGKPPAAKGATVDQRRADRQIIHQEMAEIRTELDAEHTAAEKATMEHRMAELQRRAPVVTNNDKDEIKRLLYGAGVQFLTATGEADDVLAYLCRDGTLQGVVSTDMDMLARGVPLLVTPETNDATTLSRIRLADMLAGFRLTYAQFVDACMLMGSDYSEGSMEPREAIEAARSGATCDGAILKGEGVAWADIVSQKQQEKWITGPPPAEPETVAVFATTHKWPATWTAVLAK
jgi:flap endonuclease-1